MKEKLWSWFTRKTVLADSLNYPGFHEREIWNAYLGQNIGFEQNGAGKEFLRPILIMRKFNNEIFWAIPLTRTHKNLPFYYQFSFGDGISSAILTQIRLLDVRRLGNKIGVMAEQDFLEIKQKFKALLP